VRSQCLGLHTISPELILAAAQTIRLGLFGIDEAVIFHLH